MWNDSTELVVAGSGQVYVAPVGTALPTAYNTALNAAFTGLGYHTEDGVGFTDAKEIKKYMAWQRQEAVRADVTARTRSVKFSLEQWNETNVVLAFGGGQIVAAGGGYRYDFPEAGDAIDERAMVIDCNDGSTVHRFVIARGYVTEDVETQMQRDELAVLPITFEVLTPDAGRSINYFTNSSGFVAGS